MAFEILQIPRDEKSVRAYLEQYKAIRLYSLKTAPEAFGSTYAREAAFTDDVWYNRLANPKAATFIALRADRIVCTLTLVGPLPCSPEESSPTHDPWTVLGGNTNPTYLHWRINGMFTLPEARGQGVAKALVERATKYGSDEASKSGKVFAGSIAVHEDNPAARSLYAKCGFVPIKEEPLVPGSPSTVLLLKYAPSSPEVNGHA
jgi:GNAT superfamily N-acetyltransferase